MKDLGEEKKLLGMKIERDWKGGKISLIQKGYLKKVFQKFNINNDTKSVIILLAPHFQLKDMMSPTTIEEHEYMTHVPYANIIGSLMYAIMCTRSDLSQAVSMVSRYMHDLGRGHWEAVKQILRYIRGGTIDIGFKFKKDVAGKLECIEHVDFDYAGDLDKRWSTTDYVFILSQVLVSWHSNLLSHCIL